MAGESPPVGWKGALDPDFVGTVLDVRSENEFAQDHLPGAKNVPILTNLERHVVGTLYRHASPQSAVDCAWALFQERKTQFFKAIKPLPQPLHVMCWRGGGRSRVAAQVLRDAGFQAMQLSGGHKSYRRLLREGLERRSEVLNLTVLAGLTGSGKTNVLQLLKGHPSLDLEQAARHCGSVFGAIPFAGEPQPLEVSQAWFESRLFAQMRGLPEDAATVLIEDEAKRIGKCRLPDPLYRNMRQASRIWIDLPLEARVRNIHAQYFGGANHQEIAAQMSAALSRLTKYLSAANLAALNALLAGAHYHEFIETLLIKHYDPRYRKNPPNVVHRIQAASSAAAAEQISQILQP